MAERISNRPTSEQSAWIFKDFEDMDGSDVTREASNNLEAVIFENQADDVQNKVILFRLFFYFIAKRILCFTFLIQK